MTDHEKIILTSAYSDLAATLKAGQPAGWGQVPAKVRYGDACAGRVRCEPSRWFGHTLDIAERKAFSRACQSLESAGLVVRVALGRDENRMTHLAITDAGRAALEGGTVDA